MENFAKDVFIAYNLGMRQDDGDSSYNKALEVKKLLTDFGYTCFLRDPQDHARSFDNTERIASQCKCFLFVVNKGVLKKCEKLTYGTGESILALREDSWSYAEIRGFIKQYKYKASLARNHMQCFCCDDLLSDEEIGNLHDVFVNMVPIRSINSVLEWVKGQLGSKKTQSSATASSHAAAVTSQKQESQLERTLRLANQGDADAQNIIGQYYYRGENLPQDYEEAAQWFLKAARQGHEYAQYNIGLCYEMGDGIAQSLNNALVWYTRAGNGGHVNACFRASICYQSLGDKQKSKAWQNQANNLRKKQLQNL